MKKVQLDSLKKHAQAKYYDFRRQGLSHQLAMAAVIESVIAVFFLIEKDREEP